MTTNRPLRHAPMRHAPMRHAPIRLAHTDWLHHRLTISGPADTLARFRAASAGTGVIPWRLDLQRLEEDFFHLLATPNLANPNLATPNLATPNLASSNLAAARSLAGQLREAVGLRHELALGRVGRSRACPFDLHALIPVPDDILGGGPDDPASDLWLWAHWGTTQALRHVAPTPVGSIPVGPVAEAEARFGVTFWSADWTPWRALARLAEIWPGLRFDVRPGYSPT